MASSTAAPIIPNAIISSTDRIARAHQTTFCARGLQKTIAVSEKGAGAHGNVPRAGGCSTDGTPDDGSHLAEAGAAESHAGHADGPGGSGNGGIGSHLAATGFSNGQEADL